MPRATAEPPIVYSNIRAQPISQAMLEAITIRYQLNKYRIPIRCQHTIQLIYTGKCA